VVGSTDGTVRALDVTANGAEIWRVNAGAPVAGSPTVGQAGGETRVWVATTGGSLLCVRLADGATRWSADLGGPVWSSPTLSLATGKVYVAGYDGSVRAFLAADGSPVWTYNPSDEPLGPIRASVALSGRRLYVPTLTHGLVVLEDGISGPQRPWSMTDTGSHAGSTAVVTPDGSSRPIVYLASMEGVLSAVEDWDGTAHVAWTRTGLGVLQGSVAYADGLVFVSSEAAKLRAFRATDGLLVYEVSTTAASDSSVAVAGGVAYATDGSGRLFGFGNVLEAPTGLTAVAAAVQVSLSWNPVLLPPLGVPVSGYRVYRSPQPDGGLVAIGYVNGQITNEIGAIVGVATVYVDASLTASGTYYYAVTAMHDMAGTPPGLEESTYSDPASAEVTLVVPPVVPPGVEGLAAQPYDGAVGLNWSLRPGSLPVESVWVFRRQGNGPLEFSLSLTGSPTSYNDLHVDNGVSYSYVLQAVDVSGNAGSPSNEATATPYTNGWPMFAHNVVHDACDPSVAVPLPLGQRWSQKLPPVYYWYQEQTPIVVGGTVYATSTRGPLRAYSADTGATLWSADIPSTVGYLPFTTCTPVYHHGRVYVIHVFGLSAYDAATGNLLWWLDDTVVGRALLGQTSPIVYRGMLYLGTLYGLVAVDLATQQVKWIAPMYEASSSSPTAANGLVYFVTNVGTIRALKAETGATVWESSIGLFVLTTAPLVLTASPPVLLVTHEVLQTQMLALDAATGASLWSQTLGAGYSQSPSTAPAVAGATIYVSPNTFYAESNYLEARRQSDGMLIWKAFTYTTTGAGIFNGGPVITSGRVHVYATNGQVFTFDARTGAKLDVFDSGLPLQQGHMVAGCGQLYATTPDGTVAALGPIAPAPTGLTAIVVSGDVRLAWNPAQANVYAVTGYRVYRSTLPGYLGEMIAEVNGSSNTAFVDAGPPGNAQYFYVVRSVDVRNVMSRPSGAVSVVVPGVIVLPIPPTNLTAFGQILQVTLVWTRPADNVYAVSGYLIFRAAAAGGPFGLAGTVHGPSTTGFVDHPAPGLPDYYYVAAVDVRGVVGLPSNVVAAKAFFEPAIVAQISDPPQGAQVCLTPTATVTITGTANSGNFSRYRLWVDRGQGSELIAESTTPVVNGVLGAVALTQPGWPYVYLLVEDGTGQTGSAVVYLDAPAQNLIAEIGWPRDGLIIPVDCSANPFSFTITGQAYGSGFANYRLDVARANSASMTAISSVSSTSPVAAGGPLGIVSLPDCDNFVIRLTVEDQCGRTTTRAAILEMQGATQWIASLTFFSARGSLPGEHRRPQDVAVDRDGFVWVVDTGNRRVQKYTALGQFLLEFDGGGVGAAPGEGFLEPVAAAVDSRNRLLVLDRETGILRRYDESGAFLGRVLVSPSGVGELLHPEGLAVDDLDEIYIADTLSDRVLVLNPDGQIRWGAGGSGSAPGLFHHPSGIGIVTSFNVPVVADTLNDRVQILEPFGTGEARVVGRSGNGPGEFHNPYEAVATSDGDLFVSDMLNDRIAWWAGAGVALQLVALLPPPDRVRGLFAQPHGIALNDEGSVLYVADTGHSRVVAIRLKAEVDVRAPRAVITSPAASATVSGLVDVRGVAADAHFGHCVLEYARVQDPDSFFPVTSSTDPVWNGSLGIWDVSRLASGLYLLRLTVTDKAGNTASASVVVSVAGTAALIISAAVMPSSFMPDRAGLQIAYQLSVPASVTAAVLPPNSNHPVWMGEALPSAYGGMAGPNTMAWDGRDEHGQPVAPGAYIAILVARAGDTVDRKTLSLLALLSPEAQVAAMAGPRGSGGVGAAGVGGGSSAGSGSAGSSGFVPGTAAGAPPTMASGGAAVGTGADPSGGDPHDNGWHEGNNPNGFTVEHPDNSQGNGNNHH